MSDRAARGNRLRRWSRWLFLCVVVVLAWQAGRQAWCSLVLPALSPFVALGGIVATRLVVRTALLALPVLVSALAWRRVFCRYVCPVGFLQEQARRVRPRWPVHTSSWPRLGPWVFASTMAASVAGYPAFLWLDPLAIFQGFLNAWRWPLTLGALLPGGVFVGVMVLDFVWPGVWCGRLCPLGAMQDVLQLGRQPAQHRPGRRSFFATGGGVATALLARRVQGGGAQPLRPPGAVDATHFAGVCIRCGNCTRVCPSRIIRPDLGEAGALGLFAPVLRFDADYCREDCHRCGQVCPSGAIVRLALPEKLRRRIGVARIDLDVCQLANGRECTACIRKCPFDALRAESLDGGFTLQPVLNLAKCNGCGACEAVCPVRPRRAIRVQPG